MTTKRYTEDELRAAVAESFSVMEVMRRLDLRMAGGSHSHLKNKIEKLNIDTTHFKGQGWSRGQSSRNRLDSSSILVYDRLAGRREHVYKLRRSLIESGIEARCKCGVESEWNGKPIQLEVDHINGDFLDNRIENLRFICPNCHSQEETTNKPHKYRQAGVAELVYAAGLGPVTELSLHGSSNLPSRTVKTCQDCQKIISRQSKRCKSCAGCVRSATKIQWPATEELVTMTEQYGFSGTGRMLGVSDNAVRKRIARH